MRSLYVWKPQGHACRRMGIASPLATVDTGHVVPVARRVHKSASWRAIIFDEGTPTVMLMANVASTIVPGIVVAGGKRA